MKIDRFVDSARDAAPGWSEERAGRVLEDTLVEQRRRTTRNKVARRVAGVVSVAAFAVVMLRGFASPASAASTPRAEVTYETHEALASQEDAFNARSDGGYGRD